MTDAHSAMETAMEAGLEYTALRGFAPDPKLFHYVPITLAARERVVPVIVVGDTLTLASATASPDISLVKQRFPYLNVSIVIAPPTEIDAALQRAPGPR